MISASYALGPLHHRDDLGLFVPAIRFRFAAFLAWGDFFAAFAFFGGLAPNLGLRLGCGFADVL